MMTTTLSESGIGFLAMTMIGIPAFMMCLLPCLGIQISWCWEVKKIIWYGRCSHAVVTGKDRGIISYQYRHDITPKIGPSILNHMLCVIDDDDVVMECLHAQMKVIKLRSKWTEKDIHCTK